MADNIIEVIDSGGTVVDVVEDGDAGSAITVIDGERIIDVIGATGQSSITGEDLVLSYAPSGELISVERLPSGNLTELAYDPSGLLTTVIDYRGTRTLGYTNGILTSVTWS
jgi:YD repeat-containing protein